MVVRSSQESADAVLVAQLTVFVEVWIFIWGSIGDKEKYLWGSGKQHFTG